MLLYLCHRQLLPWWLVKQGWRFLSYPLLHDHDQLCIQEGEWWDHQRLCSILQPVPNPFQFSSHPQWLGTHSSLDLLDLLQAWCNQSQFAGVFLHCFKVLQGDINQEVRRISKSSCQNNEFVENIFPVNFNGVHFWCKVWPFKNDAYSFPV